MAVCWPCFLICCFYLSFNFFYFFFVSFSYYCLVYMLEINQIKSKAMVIFWDFYIYIFFLCYCLFLYLFSIFVNNVILNRFVSSSIIENCITLKKKKLTIKCLWKKQTKIKHFSMRVSSVGPQTSRPVSVGAHAACKSPGHVMGCCSQSSPSQHA